MGMVNSVVSVEPVTPVEPVVLGYGCDKFYFRVKSHGPSDHHGAGKLYFRTKQWPQLTLVASRQVQWNRVGQDGRLSSIQVAKARPKTSPDSDNRAVAA